jgi:hypothetical protein
MLHFDVLDMSLLSPPSVLQAALDLRSKLDVAISISKGDERRRLWAVAIKASQLGITAVERACFCNWIQCFLHLGEMPCLLHGSLLPIADEPYIYLPRIMTVYSSEAAGVRDWQGSATAVERLTCHLFALLCLTSKVLQSVLHQRRSLYWVRVLRLHQEATGTGHLS